jgi:zinc transport system substrate-binding protein
MGETRSARRRLSTSGAALAVLMLVASCSGSLWQPQLTSATRIEIVTNIYALEWAVERVGGELVNVRRLTGEAHDVTELSEEDYRLLGEADVVFFNGPISPPVADLLQSTGGPNRYYDVIDIGQIQLLEIPQELGGGTDPHVWLDPSNMVKILNAAQVALAGVSASVEGLDPSADAKFFQRAREATRELENLREEMGVRLEGCYNRTLVMEHPAFGYLAEAFGLQQFFVNSPEGGVFTPTLAAIQQKNLGERWAQDTGPRTIFLDRAQSARVATPERAFVFELANDYGALLMYLENLEDDPVDAGEGDGYLAVLSQNVDRVKEGLGC